MRPAGGPAGQLDQGEADGRVARVQDRRLLDRHDPAQQPVPAQQAVERVLVGHEVGVEAPRPRVELAGDLQVLAAAVGVGELGGERQHERGRQSPQVVGAGLLVLVEQRMATRLGVALVLVEHRPDHGVAVTEVVLDRVRVALVRRPVDLAERDAVAGAIAFVAVGAAVVASGVAEAAPSATRDDQQVQHIHANTDAPAGRVEGPLPATPPGGPKSADIEDTYPWLSPWVDLAAAGYVEQEFIVSGEADAYSVSGERLATDVPYRTRIIVWRPTNPHRFNGTVLAEWQNVTAGYDLDALWGYRHIMRQGYAWVGISAQRVGVDQLAGWSPARYADLDVTGGRRFTADELSYDIFAQAAASLRATDGVRPLGPLGARTLLAIGASQSAGRMTVYYDSVLPQTEPVFDGYAFVVGTAPTRVGDEPVFQILSETDVRSPNRPPDTDHLRRWEVAGAAHSGWNGREYRRPLLTRDLGAAPTYECDRPPFSRVPLHHVIGAAYDHLVR